MDPNLTTLELQYTCDGLGCAFHFNKMNVFVSLPCEHRLCRLCMNINLTGPNRNIIKCPQCNFNKENSDQNQQQLLQYSDLFKKKEDFKDNQNSATIDDVG